MSDDTSASTMAETISNFSLSDLIRLGYPVNGTASLQPSSSSSSRPFKRIKLEKSLLANPNPSRKTFTPISLPVLLVGTVAFFSEPFSHHSSSCLNHCLSFSDSSSTICCYIIDFDPCIIGREIHVMAWNYLPIKQGHSQGVLEIIQWRFPSPDTAPCNEISLSLGPSQDSGVTARSSAFGMLKSVSLNFTHVIENGQTCDMGDSVGFLAEILTCLCDSCAKKHPLHESSGLHCFTDSKVVYFIKPCDKWRPPLAKLVGKVIYLKGLKKRLVVVGNESHVMLVSTIKTKVTLCASIVSDLPTNPPFGGVYRGVVTGIYLHGMIVELDKKVWLLIHNTLLVPCHSIRNGAIIAIRNFHTVCGSFAWTKVIILGTCVMTSLHIDSFAHSDTRVVAKTNEKSFLGNFVESLKLSAKFWVLLMVACFKFKFRTVLSEKELLGSYNSAGLVQTYASRSLPPDVFQPQNSMFTAFCNHDGSTYDAGHDQTKCKLVVPLSNFVGRCEELWISVQSQLSENSDICNNTCDDILYPSFIRRIIPSDDFGCILMGNIQACPFSGRLQLVDATGNVDVVISDLLSDLNVHTIYEVRDYRVVLEGFRIERDTSVYDFGEPLSCSAIFKHHSYKKRIHGLVFYVQFCMKNLVCLTSPSNVPSNLLCRAYHAAHLFIISHKFPIINNFSDNTAMSRCSSSFAEALIFPCKFQLSESGEVIQLENDFQNVIDVERVPRRDHNKTSEKGLGLTFPSYFHSSRNRVVSKLALTEFNSDSSNCSGDAKPITRILLEFKSLSQYQLLRIGSYNLLNCPEGCSQITMCKCLEKSRSLIVSGNNLWSLSDFLPDDAHEREPSRMTLNEVVLLKPLRELPEIMDLKYVYQGITKLFPLNQVLSVSSCMQLMFHRSRIFSGSTGVEGQRLAQGDLISVRGKVKAFHISDYDPGSFMARNCLGNPNQTGNNICIHLADDYQMVVIRGNLSSKMFPVGIGIGACATFHRLLLTFSSNRKEKLLLTPVTYIEITSVREINTNGETNQKMSRGSSFTEAVHDIPALGFFSDLRETDSKDTRFHSRVLSLNVLILENCASGSVWMCKISLAGFVLDDGSAVCNCWMDDDQASTLLNLPNICSSYFSSDFSNLERASTRLLASGLDHSSNKNGNNKYAVGYFLVNMLKKHHKVTVKNHGMSLDISRQDLSFHSSSGKVFSILEERLLNYIILNSCQGPSFSVNGLIMDANAMKQFHTYIEESETLRGSVPNIWIAEVAHIDPLKDAFNMLHDIKMSESDSTFLHA